MNADPAMGLQPQVQRRDIGEAHQQLRWAGGAGGDQPRQQTRRAVAAAGAEHRPDVRIGQRGIELA
jgi:hypothetical protein